MPSLEKTFKSASLKRVALRSRIQGWGIGLHRYELHARPYWMDDAAAVAVPASHQDQVVTLPSDARVIASSEFTPYAGLDYGGAISFQFHPEFSPAFATALIEANRDRYGALATSAIQSHLEPDDCALRVAEPEERRPDDAIVQGEQLLPAPDQLFARPGQLDPTSLTAHDQRTPTSGGLPAADALGCARRCGYLYQLPSKKNRPYRPWGRFVGWTSRRRQGR